MNCLLYNQLDENENPTAYILIFQGEINVSLNSNANRDELIEFFELNGFSCVFSNGKIFENSDFGVSMKYVGEKEPFSGARLLSSEDIKKCYKIITDNFDMNVSFEEFFVDMSHKIRHGKALVSFMGNDEIYSLAIGMYKTSFSSIISSVCTEKSKRNKGFASNCIKKLIASLHGENIDEIYVFCNENMIGFYQNLKFEIDRSWYSYVRKI